MSTPRRTEVLRRPAPSPQALRLLAGCLAVFAGARLVTSAFLLWLTTLTTAASEAGEDPSFAAISSVWDGAWYRRIAFHGYPTTLPLDVHGQVAQNEWAFLPAYPLLARALSIVTGTGWDVAAVALSLLFGAAAAVLLGLLLAPRTGRRAALFAVALFSCSPVAFVLQTAYADAMMTCLLLGVLVLVDRGRSGWAVPVVLLAAATRPGVLAVALLVVLRLWDRWRERRTRGVAGDLALLAASVAGGLAWPVAVGLATGQADAYVRTETAWRSLWTGSTDLLLFQPWFFVAQQLFGLAGVPILALLAVAFVVLLLRPSRRAGRTVQLWTASYAVYLLAVFMPQTSLPRLLLPMSPALAALPVPRRWPMIVLVLAASTALQLLWLWCTYGPVKTYLTVP